MESRRRGGIRQKDRLGQCWTGVGRRRGRWDKPAQQALEGDALGTPIVPSRHPPSGMKPLFLGKFGGKFYKAYEIVLVVARIARTDATLAGRCDNPEVLAKSTVVVKQRKDHNDITLAGASFLL